MSISSARPSKGSGRTRFLGVRGAQALQNGKCNLIAERRFNFAAGGGLAIRNGDLKGIIEMAFDVRDSQIAGPGWLASDRYDIFAKPAADAAHCQSEKVDQGLPLQRPARQVPWEVEFVADAER